MIQLLGCAILPTEAFLYLELCEGDLKGQVWREDALAPMVAQPRDAVCHIHKLHIIHMDIKPANILVKSGKPVLSDFGRACLEADVSAARVRLTRWHSPIPPAGTSCWRAPDSLHGCVGYRHHTLGAIDWCSAIVVGSSGRAIACCPGVAWWKSIRTTTL